MYSACSFRLSALALATSFVVACAVEPASPEERSSEDLSSVVMPAGYYELVASNGARWLDAVNLHADGTFEAAVGNSVSNLAGHQFPADGTYGIVTNAGHTTLTLKYRLNDATTEDAYVVEKTAKGLALQIGGNVPSEFTMKAGPKPTTLTFAADGTVAQSEPLRAGATVVVDYAAARDKCPIAGTTTGAPVFLFGRMVGADSGVERSFPEAPVNGHFRLLFDLPPAATELVLWFENNAPSCHAWDSKGGQNFHFPIARP